MTINQLLSILLSRKKLALWVFGATFVLAILLYFVMPDRYTAIASVVIDTKTDPISTTGFTQELLTSYMATEVEVMSSVRVAQRVVKTVGLDKLPQLQEAWRSKTDGQGDISIWVANLLLDSKVVIGTGKAKNSGNVITITAKWSDGKTAAAIANAFARAAIETNIELKIEPAKQFADWFNLHSVALRSSLQEKQKRLSDYENETGITATDEKLDVENARLTELSTQLVAIQGERQNSQSRLHQIGGGNESLEEVLQSPVIAKLKSDLSDAEAKQAEVAGNLGKNHPDYQAAAADVANLRNRIREESTRIANGIGTATQVNIRRENEIRDALENQKRKVLALKHQHDEAAVLQSDVDTAQRDLDAVTQRYAQSALESQAQQSTNMVQLTVATEPVLPSSPKLILNILAGIFLGGTFGIFAAMMAERRDPRIRDDTNLAELLGVPTLARIGSVKKREWRWKKSPQVTALSLLQSKFSSH
jgi:chain length determinant protein EpsF